MYASTQQESQSKEIQKQIIEIEGQTPSLSLEYVERQVHLINTFVKKQEFKKAERTAQKLSEGLLGAIEQKSEDSLDLILMVSTFGGSDLFAITHYFSQSWFKSLSESYKTLLSSYNESKKAESQNIPEGSPIFSIAQQTTLLHDEIEKTITSINKSGYSEKYALLIEKLGTVYRKNSPKFTGFWSKNPLEARGLLIEKLDPANALKLYLMEGKANQIQIRRSLEIKSEKEGTRR